VKQVPIAVARPTALRVRAFTEDASKKDTASKHEEQQHQVAKQQPAPAAMTPRSAHPVMRLPSLFHEMQREMDAMTRMFGLPSMLDDDLFFSRAPMLAKMELPAMPSMHVAVDVQEDDKAYTIKADTPGM